MEIILLSFDWLIASSSVLSGSNNDCSESNGYDLFVSVVVIGSPESGDSAEEAEDNAGESICNVYLDDWYSCGTEDAFWGDKIGEILLTTLWNFGLL